MKHDRGLLLGATALALLLASSPAALAQATTTTGSGDDEERHFGLYVEFAYGSADADPIDTSIETLSTHVAQSAVALDAQDHARAAIGWQFTEDRGDVRLTFNGYRETEYSMTSTGFLNRTSSGVATSGLVPWWNVSIVDGALVAERRPPVWTTAADLDGDGVPDPNEVDTSVANRTINGFGPESLQNQIQTIDVMYGREFGTRRFTSHWWAGLRRFSYEGNLASGAWLATLTPGQGFTDGTLLNPIVFYQEASGVGPTGAWGAEFNFFDRGLQLYVTAQSSFLFNSLDVDSGDFFTITRPQAGGANTLAPARLTESRDKSSWQNAAEIGARVIFRNGLQVEAGYRLEGYLDVVLRPFDISIPDSVVQAPAGTSALYNTQDIRIEGWHAGLSYQF